MHVVAGIDLGGSSVNYTFLSFDKQFLIQDLCEHPSLAKAGPDVCMQQISEGFTKALDVAGIENSDVLAVGLDTPGPASPKGVLSERGSTNFIHPSWAGFDITAKVSRLLNKPVTYLNDGNAGALWGHFVLFGEDKQATSVSAIIGTGLGGGVVINGEVVEGRRGFGGELGHVLIPFQAISEVNGIKPLCNCGRPGDLESLCSLTAIEKCLLPYFLPLFPNHLLANSANLQQAAKQVRGLAEKGDEMCTKIFAVQAHALALFFDAMINTFDPDALIVGGGALETKPEFQQWFLQKIREYMPDQREEQADIPIHVMPNGDTAGARGAAIDALQFTRRNVL